MQSNTLMISSIFFVILLNMVLFGVLCDVFGVKATLVFKFIYINEVKPVVVIFRPKKFSINVLYSYYICLIRWYSRK